MVSALALAALLGPAVSPYGYATTDFGALRRPPGPGHLLGTDDIGRDVLTRIMVGGRVSLGAALMSQLVALMIAVPVGLAAGFLAGAVDQAVMRAIDVWTSVPDLLLVVLLVPVLTGVFGAAYAPVWLVLVNDASGGAVGLVLAVALTSWIIMARLVRAQTLTLRAQEFVAGAIAGGASSLRIMARHLMPNLATVLIVAFSQGVPRAVLLESALGFLGLGMRPPLPSWGVMIAGGVEVMQSSPHLLVAPAVVLGVTVLCLNLLGDAIRDALDPRGIA
jgi:ABC-type dipeptide/oligopeptide/nickel transport system permease subunit